MSSGSACGFEARWRMRGAFLIIALAQAPAWAWSQSTPAVPAAPAPAPHGAADTTEPAGNATSDAHGPVPFTVLQLRAFLVSWRPGYGDGPEPTRATLAPVERVARRHEGPRDRMRAGRPEVANGPGVRSTGSRGPCGPLARRATACPIEVRSGSAGASTAELLSHLGYLLADSITFHNQPGLGSSMRGDRMQAASGAGLGMQVGLEHYNESDGADRSSLTTLGDVTDSVPVPIRGLHDVRAAHVELFAVPFVDRSRTRGLDIGILGRGFERSAEGSGFTWQLTGALWLGGGVFVRASHGRIAGAPSIARHVGVTDSFPAARDPCSIRPGRTPLAEANCRADGVPGGLIDDRAQMRATVGGNPTVGPESAATSGVGVTLVPQFARGLSLSVDYLEMTARDVITNFGAETILSNCYSRPPGERSHCDRIVREARTGAIVRIDDRVTNHGTIESAGIDAQLGYDIRTRYGHLRYHIGHLWLARSDAAIGNGVFAGRSLYDLEFRPRRKLDLAVLWDRGRLRMGAHVRVLHGDFSCEIDWFRCWGVGGPDTSQREQTFLYNDVFGSYAPSWAPRGGRIAMSIHVVGSGDAYAYVRFVQPL